MRKIKKIMLILSVMFMVGLNIGIAQDMMLTDVILDASDLTARVSPRNDLNGELCALLKIQSSVPVSIEGNVVGDVVSMGNQTWAYVKRGTKRLKLNPEGDKSLDLIFDEWGVESVNSGDCFKVEIEDLANLDEAVLAAKGTVLFKRKLYPQALKTLERLSKVTKNEELLDIAYTLPIVYYIEMGNYELAHITIEKIPNEEKRYEILGALNIREKDFDNGTIHLEKAAALGNEKAMVLLFSIYHGEYSPEYKNDEKAFQWGMKLSSRGNIDAKHYIACCYFGGIGTEKNIPMAIEFFTQAGNQGKIESQRLLGAIYTLDGTRDLAKARYWLKLAASQNDTEAKQLLKEIGE